MFTTTPSASSYHRLRSDPSPDRLQRVLDFSPERRGRIAERAPDSGSECLQELRNQMLRVNVLRNGCSSMGHAIRVPSTQRQFLEDATNLLKMEQPATIVWNEHGFQVNDVSSLLVDELVFVGTQNEYFYGTSKARSICARFLCPLRSRRASDMRFLEEEDLKEADDVESEIKQSELESNFWLNPDFDISRDFLRKVFSSIDKENTGAVTFDEFRAAIGNLKFARINPKDFNDFVAENCLDQQPTIDEAGFVQAVQQLAVKSGASLCPELSHSHLRALFCYDYSPMAMRYRCYPFRRSIDGISCSLNLKEFLVEPSGPPSSYNVRWIHVAGHDAPTLYNLADMYLLDQLEVQDTLDVNGRMRLVLHTDGHMQIVLRVLRTKQKPPLRLKDEQLCVFLMENTVLTVSQGESLDIIQQLQRRMPHLGSKIRVNNSAFLVYSLVDALVDYAALIIRRFENELKVLERKVHSKDLATPETMNHVHRCRMEMRTLRDWVRPLNAVISRLIEHEPADSMLQRLYIDARESALYLHEKAQLSLGWAQSLNEQYQVSQAHRMNEVMYLLTLVTTIFVPAQFLSSVFGMNFKNMPELKWKFAYPAFWMVTLSSMIATLIFFRRQKWI